ncbi:MAG: TMEM165/GDT1 family protein [Promethearchaeota archaeon]
MVTRFTSSIKNDNGIHRTKIYRIFIFILWLSFPEIMRSNGKISKFLIELNFFKIMDFLILFLTFGILFLGELGDKTQLIVFNLALEYKKFYKVGIGVTIGFALIVTIGVVFGIIITRFIPITIISLVSALIFILIGILESRSLKKLYLQRKIAKSGEILEGDVEIDDTKGTDNFKNKLVKLRRNPYLAGFIFIFLMELGDKTQILTITMASRYNRPIEVWMGAFFALVFVAWIGILFGAIIAKKISRFYLKLISSSVFIIIGLLTLITIIITSPN